MGLIPQDVIDRVLSSHDIVEVVGRYVQLKPAGRSFKALCPFHEEKTPSFTVNPDRQTFKCFGGCGKGGTVITFLMLQSGLSFPEALRSLAQERGITVPETGGGPPQAQGEQEDRRHGEQPEALGVGEERDTDPVEAHEEEAEAEQAAASEGHADRGAVTPEAGHEHAKAG